MRQQTHNNQQGFSAVELLITLFIGATFLMAGYLLWGQVLRNGNESARLAAASDVAYLYLRKYANVTPPPCNYTTPVTLEGPTTVSNPVLTGTTTVTVTRSCPDTTRTGITLITSTVNYQFDNTNKDVSHAMYSNR